MPFAFVFPGQGSQSVGMLAQLAGAEPLVQETFAEASDVLGYDLWKLCQGTQDRPLACSFISGSASIPPGGGPITLTGVVPSNRAPGRYLVRVWTPSTFWLTKPIYVEAASTPS